MKSIIDLKYAILDQEYMDSQFSEYGIEKNILFCNVQLSGRHFYRYILPYFCMYGEGIKTAISDLHQYDYIKQITEFEIKFTKSQIQWCDYIVFPFTAIALFQGERNVYEAIRKINANCKIVYNIDINFYEISQDNPLKSYFSEESIKNIEGNMWNCDIIMVDNMYLRDYIVKKMVDIYEAEKDRGQPKSVISCMPTIFNSEIITKNIENENDDEFIVEVNDSDVKNAIDRTEKGAIQSKKKDIPKKERGKKHGKGEV